jgi:hypothetical protein
MENPTPFLQHFGRDGALVGKNLPNPKISLSETAHRHLEEHGKKMQD